MINSDNYVWFAIFWILVFFAEVTDIVPTLGMSVRREVRESHAMSLFRSWQCRQFPL